MGSVRATLFRVSYTLHTTLPCDICCRASFNFLIWAMVLVASSPVLKPLCTVLLDPFLSDSFLAFVFWIWSTLIFLRTCLQLGIQWTYNIQPIGPPSCLQLGIQRTYDIQPIGPPPPLHSRTEFVPVGTRCVPPFVLRLFLRCLPGTLF